MFVFHLWQSLGEGTVILDFKEFLRLQFKDIGFSFRLRVFFAILRLNLSRT